MSLDLWLLHWEPLIRLTFFFAFFSILALWQYRQRNRLLLSPIKTRWERHFGILLIGTICVRLLFYALLPIALALEISNKGIGLLQMPDLAFIPYWGKVGLGIIALDLVIYAQHRAFHRIGLAWRFHKMHHSDRDLELSTGLRFHPVELIVSLIIKIVAVIFIGPPVLAVLLFEILLNGASLFTHTNVSIPPKIERIVRYFIVTPTMHRIHHSDIAVEHNSNFGFLFSIWDRVFSTYTACAKLGDKHINIGLQAYRDPQYQTLTMMLWTPFERYKKKTIYKPPTHMRGPRDL